MKNNFRTNDRYRLMVVEFPGIFFTELSGGNTSHEVAQVTPGNSVHPVNIDGPPKYEQLTLRKPHEIIKDQPIFQWARMYARGLKTKLTVIKQPVSAAGVPDGPATNYLRCSLVGFNEPDVSRGAAEAAMIELVLQPEQIL